MNMGPPRNHGEASDLVGSSDPSALTGQALAAIGQAQTTAELEKIELEYLGRRAGHVSRLLSNIGRLGAEEKAALGKAANEAKRAVEGALAARRAELEAARIADLAETEAVDITFPGPPLERGHIHVLTQVRRQIETVLESLGYQVELGPEVETEWYNFEALNIPARTGTRSISALSCCSERTRRQCRSERCSASKSRRSTSSRPVAATAATRPRPHASLTSARSRDLPSTMA